MKDESAQIAPNPFKKGDRVMLTRTHRIGQTGTYDGTKEILRNKHTLHVVLLDSMNGNPYYVESPSYLSTIK